MTTLSLVKSIRRSPLRLGFLLITLALSCFALLPAWNAFAVSPPPDGGYFFKNTAEGENALFSVDTTITSSGVENTAIGFQALYSDVEGPGNTAIGANALYSNQGVYNTATGDNALSSNTQGLYNTATGANALFNNTNASSNTANGFNALINNTVGDNNTAIGANALQNNSHGDVNTATGVQALGTNIIGSQNTANGFNALYSNTTGFRNTANGNLALYSNITGHDNTAEGFQALYHNSGSNNVGLGFNAGNSLTTGSGNVCIGYGVLGVAGESNTTRIRNIYPSVASGRAVYVNSDNKIGTLVSSRRFKDEIKPMDKASETILALNPVTFRYKKEIEPNGAIMFGLIAEEVEKVEPDLVTRNDKGEAEAVRYEAVNAMLLNEFIKEHRKVTELETTVAQQRKDFQATTAQQQKEFESKIALQHEQIKSLIAGLQKVSAQIEVTKAAPQIALNNQ
jgi:hypothetical protein